MTRGNVPSKVPATPLTRNDEADIDRINSGISNLQTPTLNGGPTPPMSWVQQARMQISSGSRGPPNVNVISSSQIPAARDVLFKHKEMTQDQQRWLTKQEILEREDFEVRMIVAHPYRRVITLEARTSISPTEVDGHLDHQMLRTLIYLIWCRAQIEREHQASVEDTMTCLSLHLYETTLLDCHSNVPSSLYGHFYLVSTIIKYTPITKRETPSHTSCASMSAPYFEEAR
ncbi:hypothetical protein ABVK25_000085 [Lepraria finkii]|uniref:Uncharacterized protein n=1 Tax=Lepraria finkii TaxID=1340010 RepID=A0ABR4BLX0_9LECA